MPKQWVNLPKEKTFEDTGIPKDRLGPIEMELEFKKTDPPKPWKVKVTPEGSDNIEYSRKEQGRNKRFKLLNYVSFGIADKTSVLLENCVQLPAAGGNKFKVEAQDSSGKSVGSAVTIETRRKLFYQVLYMKGVTPMATKGMEDEFWNPSKKYYLKLDAPEAAGEMKYHKNIRDDWSGTAGREDMFKEAKVNYKLKDLHPYTFVIVCSNQSASCTDLDFWFPFKIWGKLFSRGDAEVMVELPANSFLWYDIDDIDDAKQGGRGIWLRHRVEFDDQAAAPVKLDWANVELGPPDGKFHTKVKVAIPRELRHTVKSRKGWLSLRVKVIEGFSGGYSDPEANFITVCRHGWHEDFSEAEREQVLVHEVGHKVGMVPDGKGIAPAAPPNLYGHITTGPNDNSKGHQGPHCEKGASYDSASGEWSGTAGCVMFGATACGSNPTPATFCSDCDDAVRKVDTDARELDDFKKFITDY